MRVVKLSYPGTEIASWPVEHVRDDACGTWVASRAGTEHTDPSGKVLHVQPQLVVGLITVGLPWVTWWVAGDPSWWSEPRGHILEGDRKGWIKVDICLPVSRSSSRLEFCDLAVDVVVASDSVQVVDLEEFNTRGYPPDIARGALEAVDRVVGKLADASYVERGWDIAASLASSGV